MSDITFITNVHIEQKMSEYIQDMFKLFLKAASVLDFNCVLKHSILYWLLAARALRIPSYNIWCRFNYFQFNAPKDALLELFSIEQHMDWTNIFVTCTDTEDGMAIMFQHALKIMDAAKGRHIIESFHRMLAAVCENPDITVGELIAQTR